MLKLMMCCALLALAWPCLALAGDAAPTEASPMNRTRMTLEQRVGGEVYRKAGLAKLSPEEQWALADWIRDYTKDITAYMERQCQGSADEQKKP
jgi:hypothetical protein